MTGLHVRHEAFVVHHANFLQGAPLPFLGAIIKGTILAAPEVPDTEMTEAAALDLARAWPGFAWRVRLSDGLLILNQELRGAGH